ncbi:hypothetical protein BBOMB_1576 [Bifidobacterium bombi DSM 19703]|uniref:Uncharacterized protein n=1 Tax=Bifidobacterium bombi DSM 19703 TaxID=1341695 RepID=A0A086BND5_9BIFI|nr:hypothetical protein BBOMB_1576 [Bifidobacterium bombi DSM 19703]
MAVPSLQGVSWNRIMSDIGGWLRAIPFTETWIGTTRRTLNGENLPVMSSAEVRIAMRTGCGAFRYEI